ncbi:signal recognition particle-docking protein FtsY [Pseudooceanicola sp. MF1-13]|uniref:signal recognition particle-docking protein FtsY n=1 Tax=Pseudooceanicola sp. MF1-13 TaxID=3379095 RepID=UPI0038917141
MAFFTKLKDRLFKSSSKLEDGLDAIVEDGGAADEGASIPDATPEEVPAPPSERVAERVDETPPPAPDEAPIPDTPDEIPASHSSASHAPASEGDMPASRLPSPGGEAVPAASPDIAAAAREAAPDRDSGLLGRLFNRGGSSAPVVRRVLDDDMLEQLEELLIASDMGVDTALRVASNMAEGRMGRRVSTAEIKALLAAEITRIMEPVAKPLPLFPKKPQVVLVVGVNGSGKTTTIGKLASQFKEAGKSVVIAAGDTFRAAAVEQLEVWGQRAGVPVLKAAEGSDPAALAFDALQKAEADEADLLMIDTAGRLQNRADLMEELAKIIRVLRKKDPSAPHNTLLVLDATTGQNALSQVETFRKMADVTGLVMTKLDGTAKGGVLVALADKFGLPIHAIGVGEQIDDLAPFDPEDFARALTGADS